MGRKVYWIPRLVEMPKVSYDDIDYSGLSELVYPMPIEGGSVDIQCVIQPGESGASKYGDALYNAMEEQVKKFPY